MRGRRRRQVRLVKGFEEILIFIEIDPRYRADAEAYAALARVVLVSVLSIRLPLAFDFVFDLRLYSYKCCYTIKCRDDDSWTAVVLKSIVPSQHYAMLAPLTYGHVSSSSMSCISS